MEQYTYTALNIKYEKGLPDDAGFHAFSGSAADVGCQTDNFRSKFAFNIREEDSSRMFIF